MCPIVHSQSEAVPTSPGLPPILRQPCHQHWLLPHLRPLWQPHRERWFVDLFAGTLTVALGLLPQSALLNDSAEPLTALHYWIARGLGSDLPMRDDAALYDEYRRRFNVLQAAGEAESRDAAGLYYYLDRTADAASPRTSGSGHFVAPYGSRSRPQSYRQDFPEYEAALQGWAFLATDFAAVPRAPGDFVFASPPPDRSRSAADRAVDWDDQVRLATTLAGHEGPIVAVNAATARVWALYTTAGFAVRVIQAPNGGDGGRPGARLLATRDL